ncbi:TonB-dependent receptor domain-containing protein [Catenovulum maritimum]|uniref:Fe-regulated protein B n=1 Tax=Catenovulum maritimum TaxID=1513271 RepID=A0A0J8JHR2_9ALTE|nr:TonB-dependent receptor [Catenovulum maritimum]KMT63971.1 Fe-regulated protein B [Catenovulum maritimum]
MSLSQYRASAIALAISSAFISPVLSAAESSSDDIEVLKVWSTQVKTSSLYLRGDEIVSKQADHISDLLRTIPGIDVGGAHSLNQAITIRSLDDKDLKISIDGASQNSYMYHHMGNLQIHADILKSVDIEIGTNSVINGGLGGAVRFETKEAKDLLADDQQFGGRIQLGHGDNSGTTASLTGYGQLTDSIDFLAYFNKVERDNFEVGGGNILDHNGQLIPDTDGKVRGIAGDLSDVLFKFGYDLGDSQRIAISYETYKDKGNYSYRPDMGLATDIAIRDAMIDLWGLETPLTWPTEFTRDTLTLSYVGQFGNTTEIRASLFENESELWRDERAWGEEDEYSGYVTGKAINQGLNLIGETSFEVLSKTHNFTYGFDYLLYKTQYNHTPVYVGEASSSAEELKSIGLFVQDKIEVTDALFITPGVRYDSQDLDSVMVDKVYNQTSFALAAEYYLSPNLVVKLSSTELFKAPEIAEVFTGAGKDNTPHQEIKAETGLNSELALAYQTQIGSDIKLSTGVTFFNTKINDYIYDYATAKWTPDNIGDMKITGSEVYLALDISHFKASLSYSDADSELDAAAGYEKFHEARLDRSQGDTASAEFSYLIDSADLTLGWSILNVASIENALDINGASENKAKQGFTTHSISASWKPQSMQQLTLVVGVDNLFDEYYASQSSRTGLSKHPKFGDLALTDYEPGRNIKATVSYSF